ncbi:filamentous hemagglutinin N-terminal domain-containing protein [Coleofasciculus sp.]|uniref:filamentous hemagglutinin N-terminal domain-containing protein n=1 Tax=Coleofasciculus sp. TaxID=3100458 RepID=UPI0039F97E95
MSSLKPIGFSIAIATALLSLGADSKPIQAQSITPAADGTGTVITSDGNRIDIQGGTLSPDGSNLFHRLDKFGLSQGEIANFLSNPQIRNILAGVVGGEASLINGLIQVTGGNYNLFLMNPAGIVFGTQASLNVPAAFTATTASSIGFDSGQFNAVGDNNYAGIMGSPNQFSFTMEQPGSIINAGDLAVGEGQKLTVIAGKVINTGTFWAPGGTISIATVPGTSQVVINQDNMALGLRLDVTDLNDNGIGDISPASLAQLVTGGTLIPATEIQVDDQGQVWLAASNQPIPTETGTAVVSGMLDASDSGTGGTVQLIGQQLDLHDAEIKSGTVLLEAIGDISLVSGTIDASDTITFSDVGGNITATTTNGGVAQGNIYMDDESIAFWVSDTQVIFGDNIVNNQTDYDQGGSITITATDDITPNGNDSSDGGSITITSDGGITNGNGSSSEETPGGNSGGTIVLDPGINTEIPDTDSNTSEETLKTDTETVGINRVNSEIDPKTIEDDIDSSDLPISPVVNNVVDAAIQSVNRTSPSLPLTLQPSEVDPILEWTGNIVQDSLRANNFNRNRGLEALVNTQRHWDNFLEAVKTKDAIGITHQRISDAVINQMQNDIGQEINQRYCSSARNGVDCEEEKVNP